MINLLRDHPLILMEGAISEALNRAGRVALHPDLSISPLLYDETGRRELEQLYRGYMQIATAASLPFLMFTPTWRANSARVKASGVHSAINADAAHFMQLMRSRHGSGREDIRIGGLIGCRNDGYQPGEGLSPPAAERFHAWQVHQLARAGVDFLIAETLPNVGEALGIARAMEKTGLPYIISFVINRDGCVLDGTELPSAIGFMDAALPGKPLGYMVNCSYPTFLHAADQPPALFDRLIGYQANASSLDHSALDGAEALQADDIARWGREMLALNRTYGVRMLGGCCGTGVEHLRYIVENRTACE